MIKDVEYPKHVVSGIRSVSRSFPLPKNLRLFGADTETFFGKPDTVQAHDGSDTMIERVSGATIFDRLMTWVSRRCRERGVNIVYFHRLAFDLLVVFFEKRKEIYQQGTETHFKYKGWDCRILYGKVNAAVLRKGKTTVQVLDSRAFTMASLAKSLMMFGVPEKKLPKPDRLGEKRLDFKDYDYAKQDAISEYGLGKKILEFHSMYQVKPSISLPQFAARVFKRHFMTDGEVIPFPPVDVVKASEFSYHGGANLALDFPRVIEDAYEADISSAYPKAMSMLPQLVQGDYYEVTSFDPDRAGVYCVSGYAEPTTYPILYNHVFKPLIGNFNDVWVTGHELARAMNDPAYEFKVSRGFVWDPDDRYKHNAFADYVQHFYKLKEETPKGTPLYYFYKYMLNQLYGKAIQAVEVRSLDSVERAIEEVLKSSRSREEKFAEIEALEDVDEAPEMESSFSGSIDYRWDAALGKYVRIKKHFRAGGIYNPFVATQITGYVRGALWDLETAYSAFHAATDSVKTTMKPKTSKGLGGVGVVTFGRCYLFRNKLYLHFCKDPAICGHKYAPFRFPQGHPLEGRPIMEGGQHLCKVGLHGFKGTIAQLFDRRHELLKNREMKYEYRHMVGLREGLKRDEDVCAMVTRRELLKLGGVHG